MELPDRPSFAPMADLHLASPHELHPYACNPTMDLVVLLSQPSTGDAKGKAKAGSSRVAVWRMLGTKVWDIEVGGSIGGLAWSRDGLVLSLLALHGHSATIQHRSVHNGDLMHTLPLLLADSPWPNYEGRAGWWKMLWKDSELNWEPPREGSAKMIIDGLPIPTPVELPSPPNLNPFAKPPPKAPPGPHAFLASFPSLLLSSSLRAPPDVLQILSPGGMPSFRKSYLTGTFFLPRDPTAPVLAFAETADRIHGHLDMVLKGLEGVHYHFRDGEKQTMIWREELETCADQQGMSHPDVFADLFRLLMTGRSGNAVSEWLGNRLTGRAITKWEQTVDTAFRAIVKLLGESIIPALERIVLLLEELRGWAKSQQAEELQLDFKSIDHILDVCIGFAMLAEQIRQDAVHEALCAQEWMEWLKYEIARAAAGESDPPPVATYDLKLVWAFMINGFRRSAFKTYFPDLLERPPRDLLPESVLIGRVHRPPSKLGDILSQTLDRLRGHPNLRDVASPATVEISIASASADSTFEHANGAGDMSLDVPRAESPDFDDEASVITTGQARVEEKEAPRKIELEPWCWVNRLVALCSDLVGQGIKPEEPEGRDDWMADEEIPEEIAVGLCTRDPGEGCLDVRETEEGRWYAWCRARGDLFMVYESSTAGEPGAVGFNMVEHGYHCIAVQFFDDEELVLLVEKAGERLLLTVDYTDLGEMEEMDEDQHTPNWTMLSVANYLELSIKRYRPLPPPVPGMDGGLALNGRKGRRVGCVLMGEQDHVVVLDMEADEGDDDEEGEEEDGMDVEE